MYTAIIIDDEEMARELLNGMLQEYCPEVKVSQLCHDLPSGVKAIRKHKPDVVFLDIEMPGHSGLELLDFFDDKEVNFSIIFVTAYNRYAIQAFKLSAIDYLLKPIETQDLIHAVKVLDRNKSKQQFKILKENISAIPSKIAISTVNAIDFIALDDILFLKADGSYTQVYLKNDKIILASKSLKHFETTLLDQKNFYRCQKSYIVNIKYITTYIKSNGGSLTVGKYDISISPEKTSELLELLT